MRSIGLLPALACVGGAAAGLAAGAPPRVLAAVVPLLLLTAALAWRRHASWATTVLLVCGFATSAAALAADARERAVHPALRALLEREYGGFSIETLGPEGDHDPLPLRFELVEDAAVVGTAVTMRAAARALWVNGAWHAVRGAGIRLTVSGELAPTQMAEWVAGRTLIAPVSFGRPSRYLNAGVPDTERDLALDGTALFGSIKSALLVEVEAHGSILDERAAQVRAHVRRAISQWVSVHDPVPGGIVTAVLIGDRSGLPADVRDRLQAAGTYHVIAISGGNIAILAGLALLAPALVGVRGRAAALLAILVLLAYARIVAAEPSVWRATLMACAYLFARLLDHRTPAWHAIAVAAALMVAIHPLDLRDPGFLLSFGATAALMAVVQRVLTWAGPVLQRLRRPRVVQWAVATVAASLAVEIVLMPIAAQGFSRVTAAGVVLNLVAVPMMAVAQVAGLATAIGSDVAFVARPAGWLAWAGAHAIVESARLVEIWPWLSRRVPPPGLPVLAVYYTALLLVLAWPAARRVAAALMGACALLIVTGLTATGNAAPAETLRLTVFDVGQGESLLLESPGSEPLLVDTGGIAFGSSSFDMGRRVLAPALWSQGVHTLGALLITHADPDHVGGARALVADFAPRRLFTGVPVPSHSPSQELLAAARAAGVRLETLQAHDLRAWGRARVRVLHPPPPDWERPRVRNDDSIVLEVRYRDTAFLLTGDISAEVERAILPLLRPAPLRVLKVAHHGSRTSTSQALLDRWRPHVALISAGRGNTFGHPAPEVLERLAGVGAVVYRTDRDGQITVATDGRSLRIETFVPRFVGP